MNNFISTNIKREKNLAPFSIGRNKIVHQENKNILGEIIVSFFSCFVNPFPGLNCRDLLSHSNIQFSVTKWSKLKIKAQTFLILRAGDQEVKQNAGSSNEIIL